MPGLPQQVRLPPTPSWNEQSLIDWTRQIHGSILQTHRQVSEIVNALLKVGLDANRTATPGFDEIFWYSSDTTELFIGVDGVWEPIAGGRLLDVTVDPVFGGYEGFKSIVTASVDGVPGDATRQQFHQAIIGESRDGGFDTVDMTGVTAVLRVEGDVTGAFWASPLIAQNLGSQPAQSLIEANGPCYVGLDLTNIQTRAAGTWTRAAVALQANARIYFNATPGVSPGFPTATGTEYIVYDSGSGALVTVVDGNAIHQVYSNQIISNANHLLQNNLNFNNSQMTTGASAPAFAAANKPGATAGAGPAKWIPIQDNGTTMWVPAWAA